MIGTLLVVSLCAYRHLIMKNEIQKSIDEYIENVDVNLVNSMLDLTELKDFTVDIQTIRNVSEWALNGASDSEIRQKLSLTKHEWSILCNVCPTLLIIMKESRAMADIVIAGSLFQAAIGGQKIKKLVPKTVKEYDDKGRVCSEHLETIEIWEELPPNPMLLKFLAENKLSDKFGEIKTDNQEEFKKILERFTPEELALIEKNKNKGNNNA